MTGPTGDRQQPADPPARILVVDDEPLNVDYLEQELECHGFVTETAANGLEALERIAAAPPDLVLLDVMMPELDGISALRILKSDPETRLIPVVLMTALNAVEDRVRGIEAGADDFLSKPVDERELLARIRTALSLKRTIDETVGELRSTSEHLERYGKQEREVAILAIEWRPRDPALPAEVVAFVGRAERAAAEGRIRGLGGMPSEGPGELLVAVFDGADPRMRAPAAVEAALTVLAERTRGGGDAAAQLTAHAAIGAGRAAVGSTRIDEGGTVRWVYGAEGDPVEQASRLVHDAGDGEILAAPDAAAEVSDRFDLTPVADGAYRVLEPAARADEPGAASPPSERRIRTILTTDVVGSTRTVERIGDRAWGELIAAHEQGIRSELVRFGGEEIDTAGDGFIGAFDSPARAIHCALAVIGCAADLGLAIRAGIHTGEVEHLDGRPRGITLHVSSRIAAHAGAGELLVSATTRELAAGSGLVFTDRGEHALKGVEEPRRLFAAVEPATAPSVREQPARPDAYHAGAGEYPAGLTAREVDVLRLVAIGLSDAETAERLFLSVRTVNAHLRSIYRKLGIRSRAAAGRFAQENGLL